MAATETSTRAAAALDDLYRHHVGEVYRYTYAVLGNHADAEDVTQTTFVNALRALERGEAPRNPSSWLIAIAQNVVRQRWRQAAARPAEVELVQDVPAMSVEDDVELEELVRALQRIPPTQREALVLRELEGRSYNEIAELLGLTTAALETLLFRARRSLADELENLVTCQSAELAMSKQLDGRLSRKEKRRLDDHLAECADCARLAQTHSRQRRAFKGLAVLPLPIGLALFKGAPNAAAAASLPTIGAGGITSNGAGTAAATAGAGGTATGAAGGAAVGGSLVAAGLKVAAVIVAATVATGAAYRSVEALRDSGVKVAAVAPVTHGTTGSAGAGPLRSSAAQAATQQPATTGDETAPGGAAALGTGAHVVDAEQADDSAPTATEASTPTTQGEASAASSGASDTAPSVGDVSTPGASSSGSSGPGATPPSSTPAAGSGPGSSGAGPRDARAVRGHGAAERRDASRSRWGRARPTRDARAAGGGRAAPSRGRAADPARRAGPGRRAAKPARRATRRRHRAARRPEATPALLPTRVTARRRLDAPGAVPGPATASGAASGTETGTGMARRTATGRGSHRSAPPAPTRAGRLTRAGREQTRVARPTPGTPATAAARAAQAPREMTRAARPTPGPQVTRAPIDPTDPGDQAGQTGEDGASGVTGDQGSGQKRERRPGRRRPGQRPAGRTGRSGSGKRPGLGLALVLAFRLDLGLVGSGSLVAPLEPAGSIP